MTDLPKQLIQLIDIDHDKKSNDSSLSSKQYQEHFINQWFEALLSVNVDDFTNVHEFKQALLSLGKKEQRALWQHNDALKQPLQRLMNDQYSGEKVNGLLGDLQQNIAKLRPPKNKKGSLKTMFLLLFSSQQTAWQLWLENYHELKKHINASTELLAAEKRQLLVYNAMLIDKKHKLVDCLSALENALDIITLMVERIQKDSNHQFNQDMDGFIHNECLPVLEKRIFELQQQLLIGRQTVMTIDVIVQQNNTQANGIDQALYTTSAALDVTAGLVLAEQGKESLERMDKKSSPSANKGSVNAQQLVRVQQRIEQALREMDDTRKKHQESSLNREN